MRERVALSKMSGTLSPPLDPAAVSVGNVNATASPRAPPVTACRCHRHPRHGGRIAGPHRPFKGDPVPELWTLLPPTPSRRQQGPTRFPPAPPPAEGHRRADRARHRRQHRLRDRIRRQDGAARPCAINADGSSPGLPETKRRRLLPRTPRDHSPRHRRRRPTAAEGDPPPAESGVSSRVVQAGRGGRGGSNLPNPHGASVQLGTLSNNHDYRMQSLGDVKRDRRAEAADPSLCRSSTSRSVSALSSGYR